MKNKIIIPPSRQAIFDANNIGPEQAVKWNEQVATQLTKLAKVYKISLRGDKIEVGNKIILAVVASNNKFNDLIVRRIEAKRQYAQQFETTFNRRITEFWSSPVIGLDIARLDQEIIKSKPSEYVADVVRAKFGESASTMVQALI